MQHGSELNEALQRQAQQQSGGGEGLSQGAPSQPSGGTPSSALQQQQPAPLQHFMMAEQVQAISVSPSQQNPHSNLLAQMQALQQQQQQRAINPLTQVFPLSPPLTHHQQQQSPQQQQRAVTTLHQAQPIFSLSPQQPLTPQPQQQQQQQQQQRLFAQTSPITFSTSPMSTAIKPPASHLVANSLQRHLSSPAGMMTLPPLSPGRSFQAAGIIGHATSPSSSSGHQGPAALIFQQDSAAAAARELQIQRQHSYPGTSSVSATGGTIHHHGLSPSRGGIPPLANPQHQNPSLSMNVQQQGQALQAPSPARLVTTTSTGGATAGQGSSLTVPTTPLSDRTGSAAQGQSYVQQSPTQSPLLPRKRIKLEEVAPASEEIANYRRPIIDYKTNELTEIKEKYTEDLCELFFLQNGGNIMDYYSWKKRPTAMLINFLKSGSLDSDEEEGLEKSINNEVKVITTSGSNAPLATPVAISTTLPAAVSAIQQQQQQQQQQQGQSSVPSGPPPPYGSQTSSTVATSSSSSVPASSHPTPHLYKAFTEHQAKTAAAAAAAASGTASSALAASLSSGTKGALNKPLPKSAASRLVSTRQHSISAVYDSTIGSQEAIVERAKQEAQVMQRIAELRKDGLWTARRLPKVQEPARNKAHWDYLLEEMQWLSADFAQERKFKKAACRKIARMISKYHLEQQQKELRAEKEEGMRLKRIASSMSKMVKEFWNNIEKVVQYKQQSRLEEKRKKALDLHLNFIVDQTEKYSSWLTEGLQSGASRASSSVATTPTHSSELPDDGDFEPAVSDLSDDEETIAREEQDMDEDSTMREIEALQKESELPIEELLGTLPSEILEKPASISTVVTEEEVEDEDEHRDREFDADGEDDKDMEESLAEQEKHERKTDYSAEIRDLEDDNNLTVEELTKKYAGAYDSDFEMPESPSASEEDSDDYEEEEESQEEETEEEEEEDLATDEEKEELEDVGMEYLIHPEKEEPKPQEQVEGAESKGPSKEITDIAATAQSLQPTGYTLETTQVKTPVPFLLKHTLREYQHVGLEWLATLYDRKLNGILADEMGLGKTIQTIALLAHLACEKGIWGPHLIVVPTSVMLNWEMEFKKWCPAFKILTYYGNQKERKQKRTGWTKTNAFHVCITSYKLVIQDHQSFRRKKWKYFILDEAQNIKNFKSQRWQTLLNFSSQRRLLLTGTPLQNSLMELWSLMHFLMPHVFQSHREFKEWFSNPLSGMIEGSREYNESLIKRLHKVLRPFLLRRLKADVEKQMPKKYEHVVMCRLSKRQRFLYDDFMSQTKTKETLASGHFMSVINILMQLRKVCNHPNLFDARPILSSFNQERIPYHTASQVLRALEKDRLEHVDYELHPNLADMELQLPAYAAHRVRKLQTPKQLIVEIDSQPEAPPRPKPVKLKPILFQSGVSPSVQVGNPTIRIKPLVLRTASPLLSKTSGRSSPFVPVTQRVSSPVPGKLPLVRSPAVTPNPTSTATPVVGTPARATPTTQLILTPSAVQTTQPEQLPGYTGGPFAAQKLVQQTQTVSKALTLTTSSGQVITSQPITVQIHHTNQGTRLMIPSGQLSQLPAGFIQIVQTSTGQQIITTAQPPVQAVQPVQNVHSINAVSGGGQATQLHLQSPPGATAQPQTLIQSPPSQQAQTVAQIQQQIQAQQLRAQQQQQQQGQSPQLQTLTPQLRAQTTQLQPQLRAQAPQTTMLRVQAPAQQQQQQQLGVQTPVLQTQQFRVQTPQQQIGGTPIQIAPAQLQSVQQPQLVNSSATAQTQQTLQTIVNGLPSAATSVHTTPVSTAAQATVVSSTSLPQVMIAKPSSVVQLPTAATTTASGGIKPVVRVSPMATGGIATAAASSVTQTAVRAAGTTLVGKQEVKSSSLSSTVRQALADRAAAAAATTSTMTPKASTPKPVPQKPKEKSPFYLEPLENKKKCHRKELLERIARLNKRHCEAKPVYGEDLCRAVNILNDMQGTSVLDNTWHGLGMVHCHNVHNYPKPSDSNYYWTQTKALGAVVHTAEQLLEQEKEILDRFILSVPPVIAPSISMHTSHPPPSLLLSDKLQDYSLRSQLPGKVSRTLHRIGTNMTVQFPEARLIQYDCGKLQTLDVLLRQLKSGDHRVLIFTQMTKMLDVLEAFLNYHGHRYLRLDGTTKVEQRQALMDRFNADKRIFVFILSTRSGGIGVNLTGADTVIFYDSDWNPTMDAQAQDRCHRIGQTRDVHIYRLISKQTVEENILKKANQKRLLGDVAIEGGNFTTAFFKQKTLEELFAEPSGLESLAEAKQQQKQQQQQQQSQQQQPQRGGGSREKAPAPSASGKADGLNANQLEQALTLAEDDTDVQATKLVKAEQQAELAEFDEDIPWDEKEAERKQLEDESMVERELTMIDNELSPVERYAVIFMETQLSDQTQEQLKQAEEEVNVAKHDWELGRLQALKEEEERRAEFEEDEMLFTFSREDAQNQVKKRNKAKAAAKAKARSISGDMKPVRQSARASSRRSSPILKTSPPALPPELSESMIDTSLTLNSTLNSTINNDSVNLDTSSNNTPVSSTPRVSRSGRVIKIQVKTGLGERIVKSNFSEVHHNNNNTENGFSTPKARSRNNSVEQRASSVRSPITIAIPKISVKAVASPASGLGSPRLRSTPNPKVSPKSPKETPKEVIKEIVKEIPKETPKSPKENVVVFKKWSNPNLVIRTRRASVKAGRLRRDSESSEVDIETVSNEASTMAAARSRASSISSSRGSSRHSSPSKIVLNENSSMVITTRRRSASPTKPNAVNDRPKRRSRASSQESVDHMTNEIRDAG